MGPHCGICGSPRRRDGSAVLQHDRGGRRRCGCRLHGHRITRAVAEPIHGCPRLPYQRGWNSAPNDREIAGDLVAAAELFVDSRAQAEIECGELRLAVEEGVIGPTHLRAELGEVLIGRAPGRSDADGITLFKSLGLAVEDLAAAEAAVLEATVRGVGTRIAW